MIQQHNIETLHILTLTHKSIVRESCFKSKYYNILYKFSLRSPEHLHIIRYMYLHILITNSLYNAFNYIAHCINNK